MGLVKEFKGLHGYKDEGSIFDVLSYALGSPYADGYWLGNLNETSDVRNLVEQFQIVESKRSDLQGKVKIHHFVLSVQDLDMRYEAVEDLGRVVKDYFRKQHFQAVVVLHRGSRKHPYQPHLHVIINHCNIYGDLFYGRNTDYANLLHYLEKVTHKKWSFIYAEESDYDPEPFLKPRDFGCII